MPSDAKNRKPGGHRYPWDDWLVGRTRVLRRGVEFDCEPASMGIIVRLAAKRRGVRGRYVVSVAGDEVIITPKD